MDDERAVLATTVLVNGQRREVRTEPDTALLYVLRNHLGLKGTRFGCGLACAGRAWCWWTAWSPTRATCRCGRCGTRKSPRSRARNPDQPHPVTRALIAGQAAQCGYCLSGVIIAAVGLLRRNADPSDEEIRAALDGNLCRCGAHNRIVRAVLEAAAELRGGPGGDGMNPSQGIALPPSVAANPRLGDWLRVLPSGLIEVRPGKVELGQGVLTALAQVAAEELDIGLGRVRMMSAVTGMSPDEGYTSGSLSIQHSGAALRLVCAEARGRYLNAAAARLGVPEDKLTVSDGQILAPDGRATSYWELAGDGLLDRPAAGGYQPSPLPRIAWSARACPAGPAGQAGGRPRYTHDLVTGRPVLRPDRPPALARSDAGRPRPGGGAGLARRAHGGAGRQLPRRGRRARGGRAARRRQAVRRRHLGAAPDAAGLRGPAGLPALGGRRDHRAGRARRPPPRARSPRRSRRRTTGRTWRTRPWVRPAPPRWSGRPERRPGGRGCGCGRTPRASTRCAPNSPAHSASPKTTSR